MRTILVERKVPYSGTELRSSWPTELAGADGDAVVAWFGPCDVPTENLVDMEDAGKGEVIRAKEMLHLIVRVMERDLERAVLRQRLLAVLLCETLSERGVCDVRREGDDVFVGGRKLTVSIATLGRNCSLVHFGVNVDASGAPVPAVGLADLGLEPRGTAEELLERFLREHSGVRRAVGKVRHVE